MRASCLERRLAFDGFLAYFSSQEQDGRPQLYASSIQRNLSISARVKKEKNDDYHRNDYPNTEAELKKRRTGRCRGVVEKDRVDGFPQNVFETDRSAVSGGVSRLRSGRHTGDFRCRRP